MELPFVKPHNSNPDRTVISFWMALVAVVITIIAFIGLPTRATYGARTSADEPQYLLTATSLAEDFDLDISDEIRDKRYLPYHEISLNPQTFPLDDSGRRISPHDPFLPAILAIPVFLGGWIGAKVTLALIAAATAALATWLGSRRFGISPPVSALVTTACFAGIPLAAYGTQIYPEMPAALITLTLVASLTANQDTTTPHSPSIILTLTSIVALPWLAVKYVPIAAVGAITLLLRLRHYRNHFFLALAALALAAIVYMLSYQWIYGGWTAYATGDHFTNTGEFSVTGTNVDLFGRGRRLIGLLVDRQFGIATWSPIWFLLPLAIISSRSLQAPHRRFLITLVAVTWINATFVALTMHGWWVPGRQIVVALPIVAILIALWADGYPKRTALVATLGATGLVNWVWLSIEASTGHRTLIVDFAETASLPYRIVAPVLPDGIAGGFSSDITLIGWTILIITPLVAMTLCRACGRPLRGSCRPPDCTKRVPDTPPRPSLRNKFRRTISVANQNDATEATPTAGH